MDIKTAHRKGDFEGAEAVKRSGGRFMGSAKNASSTEGSKESKPPSWTSSISTITEELPIAHVPEPMTRVPSAASAASHPYCSPMSDEFDKKKEWPARWCWNKLPKPGESVHSHKHSLNVAVHCVNGTPRQIVYDPRYNPLFSKLEIFYMFNAQSPLSDCYTHAKERLESYVKFLELYHSSRQYASAYLPFNVNITPSSTPGGYPSYTVGVSYHEIGEILQLWYLQSLKFLVDKNSFLFANEIVDYLTNYGCEKHLIIKREILESSTPPSALQETVCRSDILLIRCIFEEEIGWQLALDEPNWNIVDLFIDFHSMRQPRQNDGVDKNGNVKKSENEADDLSTGVANRATDSESSTTSLAESSTATTVTTSSSDISYGRVSQVMKEPVQSDGDIFVDPQTEIPLSKSAKACHIVVQDCVGRDLDKFRPEMKARSSFDSQMSSLSQNSSLENISIKKDGPKDKKEHSTKTSRGAASLGISNFFKRKNSHANDDKSDKHSSSRRSSPGESTKMNLCIQNSFLEDYYASTLANYRRLVIPNHCVFYQKELPYNAQGSKSDNEAKTYRREFLKIKLPLKDNSFPVVMCPDIWLSIDFKKWKNFLSEIYRCIRPGGFLETSTSNFTHVNDSSDLEKTKKEFPSMPEVKAIKDVVSMEAVKLGVQVFPMRQLVQVLKTVGFVNIKHSVLSLKRGDLRQNMGMLFEFVAMRSYDYQLRSDFLTADTTPAGTNPATLPSRYVQEHMGKSDQDAGVVRVVLVTAQKPRAAQ